MMTPQEVASHAFAKATLGGYNMAMVDEFLDILTEDYTTLYNDNAILKNKLKILSETVEEYRATDNAMRKTLLAAQQMADAMVKEAEQKQAELLGDAEATAQKRLADIRQQVMDEEQRLKRAREATAAYVQKVLAALKDLSAEEKTAPAEEPAAPVIELFPEVPEEKPVEEEPVAVAAAAEEPDPSATRRFENLQFGKDYEIR